MQLKVKISSAIATGVILSSVFAPTAFAQTAEISGNGDSSTNTIGINITSNCSLKQKNSTYVDASVHSSANTGGNNANSNTGADVTIDTGNASSSASLVVNGGSNEASGTDACCCDPEASPPDALISGNGVLSSNTVGLNKTTDNKKKQKTRTRVSATVGSKAKTGKNNANSNTGNVNGGVVTVLTGDSGSSATATVTGGSNTLNP